MVILIVFIIFGLIYEHGGHRLDIADANPLSEGWKDHATNTFFDLPYDFNLAADETHGFSLILPEDFKHPQYILIRGSLQDVVVAIGGNIIYSHDLREEDGSIPYASLWHYIPVPADSDGLELTVFLSTPFEAMSGKVNEIYYGSYHGVNAHILINHGQGLIVGILTLVIGLAIVFISLFVDKIKDNDVVYLGLFAIILSLWMISESRAMQFFIDSQYILGGLSYYALALLAIPMAVYLKRNILKDYVKIFHGVIIYWMLLFIGVVVLQELDILGFFESVVITQISLLVSVLLTFVLLILNLKKHPKNQPTKTFLAYFAVFTGIAFFEFISFILEDFDLISVFVQGIVVIFMVVLFSRYILILNRNYHIRVERETLEKMAYIDKLTGSKNRHAFEEDLELLFNHPQSKKQLKIVYFDFDDLKNINDNFGHDVGDQILKDGYLLIENTFGELGKCYRIGGDEFSCIFVGISNKLYQQQATLFNQQVVEYNQDKDYEFRVSYGIAAYQPDKDVKPKDLVKRADHKMYLEKEKNKLS
jgi:diguanylate cyclase (GGDEF)-like protein